MSSAVGRPLLTARRELAGCRAGRVTKGQGRGLPELRGLGREPEEAGEAGIGRGRGVPAQRRDCYLQRLPLETSAEYRPEHTWDETAEARESAT